MALDATSIGYYEDAAKGRQAVHVFEAAGLGKAPYRFLRVEQKIFCVPGVEGSCRPGGSCHYCSTAITNCYWLESADGHKFYVGCDCINKSGDRGLIRIANEKEKLRKREAKRAKDDAKLEALKAEFESLRWKANTLPSPSEYYAKQGQTLANSVDWFLQNAGMTGKLSALRSALAKCRS